MSKLPFRSFALSLHKTGCTRENRSKLLFRSFALSLQNNCKFIAVTGQLDLSEPITLDEMNGIYLMDRTVDGFATTEKFPAVLLVMAQDAYPVQESDGGCIVSCRTVYSDTLRVTCRR